MNKTALLIGASGGIGKAIASQLLKNGYFIYLHYNKNKDAIEELKQQFGEESLEAVQANLSDINGVDSLKNQIGQPIQTIIYNAGISYYGLMTDISKDDMEGMIRLHITSLYDVTKNYLPNMIKNKNGNIIVISSIWGEIGASCEVLYSMTKGGQLAFVKALAKEVAPSGIRVNAVSPGAINTQMLDQFSTEELMDLTEEIPIGRLGYPSEIADAVSFLLSDKSSYITGQVLSVNGGWY
ncbi:MULTISPECIES: elongation factor P 5-aminopentanone reductase [Sutcliffiella]|uniref:3-oxoacyl-ACP reductase n=1 Tax=Sutcliffiella cohnii TaxID=33932 RepID=A0A223KRI0_9BACI|nr:MULTISPECIES: SDR family oxidoreductase [Sutcliffiella]AST91997.1 3-oxoacyl-ACP reductase [Sutcliffiella cohnii]WBL13237.1 SDR family oxidoreductase [Sutcliffiella sp. NC1]